MAFGAQGGGYRRAGIEQEFFLVDTSGRPSGRADELLEICRERGWALRHYEQLVELLDERLGTSPAPETRALHERLRAGDEEV